MKLEIFEIIIKILNLFQDDHDIFDHAILKINNIERIDCDSVLYNKQGNVNFVKLELEYNEFYWVYLVE